MHVSIADNYAGCYKYGYNIAISTLYAQLMKPDMDYDSVEQERFLINHITVLM